MNSAAFFRMALIGGIACALSSCGFSPMYGTHARAPAASGATAEAALADVSISNIPDRNGVLLRNALIDRFYQHGYPSAPRYTLTIEKVSEVKRELDLTKSSEATRSQLVISTKFKFFDNNSPTPLLERSLTSTNSYNILESEFSTRVTEDSARVSGMNDLARQIELNLVLYLNRAQPAAVTP